MSESIVKNAANEYENSLQGEESKPLLDQLLNDYTPEQFSEDASDYILADDDNERLQKALKEAVWWDINMIKGAIAPRQLTTESITAVYKLAEIGRIVLENLYATTEGK